MVCQKSLLLTLGLAALTSARAAYQVPDPGSYAGEDPTAPTEIGDLCEGLYGTGGGGGYIGQVMSDKKGRTFNMNGKSGRKFLVQWVWSPALKACAGPNALD